MMGAHRSDSAKSRDAIGVMLIIYGGECDIVGGLTVVSCCINRRVWNGLALVHGQLTP